MPKGVFAVRGIIVPSGRYLMKSVMFTACICAMLLSCVIAHSAEAVTLTDEEIMAILVDRVDTHGVNPGIVVGIVTEDGRRVIAHGKYFAASDKHVGGDTIFEIGSITKVFTSLVLADMTNNGSILEDDPVAMYMPEGVTVPERNGESIRLVHLATHTSGLPRAPANLVVGDRNDPLALYTNEMLYEFLGSYQLPRDIGAEYEYSNVGAGLLGHALELRDGLSYEEMVVTRICGPLNMPDTRVTMSSEQNQRFAAPHNEDGIIVKRQTFQSLEGCGALKSTANDMLSFLAANLGLENSSLYPAMTDAHEVRHWLVEPYMGIGLAWFVQNDLGVEVIFHGGTTVGFNCFAGICPEKKLGVVILANSYNTINDIGMHLLDQGYPLRTIRTEVTLTTEILDRYVGVYRIVPDAYITVRRYGSKLYAQVTGQPMLEICAENQTGFFYRDLDAQITFTCDDETRTTGLIVHQSGVDVPCSRLGYDSDGMPEEVLDDCVGIYRFSDGPDTGKTMEITRSDDGLVCVMPDGRRVEFKAEFEDTVYSPGTFMVLRFVEDGGVLYVGGDWRTFSRADDITFVDEDAPEPLAVLEQNMPNPFNPVTTISYVVPSDGPVRLTVYNIAGQVVAVPVDGFRNRGRHEVVWDARTLPSGVYFYRIDAVGLKAVRKMMLMK